MQLVARSSYERPQPLRPPPNRTLTFAIEYRHAITGCKSQWVLTIDMFGLLSLHVSNINAIRERVQYLGLFSSSCLELPQILSHVIPCAVRRLPYLEPLSRILPSMLTGRTMSFHTGGTDEEAHPRHEQDQRSRSDTNSDERALPPLPLKSK